MKRKRLAKKYRTFNGKRYKLNSTSKNITPIKSMKEYHKDKGEKVRVIRSKDRYALYTRKK